MNSNRSLSTDFIKLAQNLFKELEDVTNDEIDDEDLFFFLPKKP